MKQGEKILSSVTSRRVVLQSTASLAVAASFVPGQAQACHTYPGGCAQAARDKASGGSSSTSSGGSSTSSGGGSGSATPGYLGRYVGCHVNGGGVGNWLLRAGQDQSMRFKAEATGTVTACRWWNKFDYKRSGYHYGNGGDIIVELKNGLNGSVLARSDVLKSPLRLGYFPKVRFQGKGAYLKQGGTYYLSFRNISSGGGVSLNYLHGHAYSKPRSAWSYWGDTLATYRKESGRWVIKQESIPIFELFYSNGKVKGQGYIQGNRSNTRGISKNYQVRQSFVAGSTMGVRGAFVRVYQTGSSADNLHVQLKCANGKIHASGQISKSAITRTAGDKKGSPAIKWNNVRFNKRVTLKKGVRYYVVLAAPRGGTYQALTTQNAYYNEGFREDKLWRNARGEFTTNGKSWTGFEMFGKRNRKDLDCGILLEI